MLSQALSTENPKGFLNGLRRVTYSSSFYNYTLLGWKPTRLLGTPRELFPGKASAGQSILAGLMPFYGRQIKFNSFNKLQGQFSEHWLAYLHSFKWLSDLHRVGSDEARQLAQRLILEWIEIYGTWDEFYWRPDILGARLASWTANFAFFSSTANQLFLNKVLIELGRQSRHLSRTVLHGLPGYPRIVALKGLIYAGISLPQSKSYLVQAVDNLEYETTRQVYPDGGHVSRNPKIQMEYLREILEVKGVLLAAHYKVPNWINEVSERMASMLKGMCLGDGKLVCFNGGISGDPNEIKELLSNVNLKKRVPSAYLHSGFHRLEVDKTILVMDVGKPPNKEENRWAHAGTLSFELSVGKERLIVNCGASELLGKSWRQAFRSTAAHTTMSVDDVNTSELGVLGGCGRIPQSINCSRREINNQAIIEARNDGYKDIFDLIHRRIVTMSPDGSEILGEDRLEGTGGRNYVLRFHLHPNVQATIIQHGKAVLLKPRKGPGWKLSVSDQEIFLEDSVYLDGFIRPRRSQQVVIGGKLYGRGVTVNWSLARI